MAMVKDPPCPTDLEEVVGGNYVPLVDPKTRREISSHVPDGDYSDRTNHADLCPTR